MKKISALLVVLLALWMALPASSQINLGVLGGVNLANLSYDPEPEGFDFPNRMGFRIGGVLDYNMNKSIAFHLEPMYLLKGGKAESDAYDVKTEIKLAYLEVPVMLKYSFAANDIKPYIIAGPTIGFNLSSKGKETWGGVSEEYDSKDQTSSIDFGLGFGAGVSQQIGNNFIFVEARYALGLTKINDVKDPGVYLKNKGIQIFAGITFPLDGE